MNHVFIVLITMLISMSTSAFAATTTSKECKIDLTSIAIPANITVKQTVTFKDGTTTTLYYQKQGDTCKLYSTTDLSHGWFGCNQFKC